MERQGPRRGVGPRASVRVVKLVNGWIEGVPTGHGRLHVRDGENVAQALERWRARFQRDAAKAQTAADACLTALRELDNQGQLL